RIHAPRTRLRRRHRPLRSGEGPVPAPVRKFPRGEVAGPLMSAEADRRFTRSSDGRWDGEIPQIPRESATIADGALRSQLEALAHSQGSPPWMRRMRKAAEVKARDAAVLMLFGRGGQARTEAGLAENRRLTELGVADVDIVLLQRATTL